MIKLFNRRSHLIVWFTYFTPTDGISLTEQHLTFRIKSQFPSRSELINIIQNRHTDASKIQITGIVKLSKKEYKAYIK